MSDVVFYDLGKHMKTTIVTPRGTPHEDMAREEQLHSLLDGRARWPDGTPRKIGIPLYERLQQRSDLDARGRHPSYSVGRKGK